MASDSSCSSPHPLFSLRATRPDCKPLDVEVVPLVADRYCPLTQSLEGHPIARLQP